MENNSFHDELEYRQELNLSGLFASSLEGCGLSDLWFLLGANIP